MATKHTVSRIPMNDVRILTLGEIIGTENGRSFDPINTANEEIIGRGPRGSSLSVHQRGEAAKKAQQA